MAVHGKRLGGTFLVLVALALLAIAGLAHQAPGRGAEASATKAVTIKNFAFRPATLKVRPGTRVKFTNSSSVTHTATRDGGGFDTRRIAPEASATVRFKRRGTFSYHCKIHPFMEGKIVVE